MALARLVERGPPNRGCQRSRFGQGGAYGRWRLRLAGSGAQPTPWSDRFPARPHSAEQKGPYKNAIARPLTTLTLERPTGCRLASARKPGRGAPGDDRFRPTVRSGSSFSWLARTGFGIDQEHREGLAMASAEAERPTGGELSVAISNRMVQLSRRTTGRGPTKSRTTIGRDHVLIMIPDALTTGERTLVEAGYGEEVILTRRRFQEVMRPEATRMIEELTGRTVIGMMSDNHANPDLGVGVFIPEPTGGPSSVSRRKTAGREQVDFGSRLGLRFVHVPELFVGKRQPSLA